MAAGVDSLHTDRQLRSDSSDLYQITKTHPQTECPALLSSNLLDLVVLLLKLMFIFHRKLFLKAGEKSENPFSVQAWQTWTLDRGPKGCDII